MCDVRMCIMRVYHDDDNEVGIAPGASQECSAAGSVAGGTPQRDAIAFLAPGLLAVQSARRSLSFPTKPQVLLSAIAHSRKHVRAVIGLGCAGSCARCMPSVCVWPFNSWLAYFFHFCIHPCAAVAVCICGLCLL